MPRNAILLSVLVGLGVACGGGNGSPAGPTTTTTSVSVRFPAGGTIFIGNVVQFEAVETLSNGTTRVATNATWGSDATAVATVSPTGLVTAVRAGEATIFADVNPRGTLRIRVFPNFGGSWAGSEVVTGCEDSGAFEGLCGDPDFPAVGEEFVHNTMFTQTEASVAAEIDLGGGDKATMTGTITIGGELQLPTAPVLPPDPTLNVQVQNWRSRADIPAQMTGTYEGFITAPGVTGSITLVLQLRNVVRRSATTSLLSRPGGSSFEQALRRIANHLKPLR